MRRSPPVNVHGPFCNICECVVIMLCHILGQFCHIWYMCSYLDSFCSMWVHFDIFGIFAYIWIHFVVFGFILSYLYIFCHNLFCHHRPSSRMTSGNQMFMPCSHKPSSRMTSGSLGFRPCSHVC